MKKKVLVLVADDNYIEHCKAVIHSAVTVGKWDGDIRVIVPLGTTLPSDFKHEVFEVEMHTTENRYNKFFLFHEYFNQWDWIFYTDLDVLFIDKIELDLEKRDTRYLYANPDGNKDIQYQYKIRLWELKNMMEFVTSAVHSPGQIALRTGWLDLLNIKPNQPAFQSCFMLFNRRLIATKTFRRLIDAAWSLNPFVKFEDQGIFNTVLHDKWKPLSNKFENRCPVLDQIDWHYHKIHEVDGHWDRNEYEDMCAIHFFRYFTPWMPQNKKWYPVYREHLEGYEQLF
jgi:lipopolysaccharide biosynthesis glycosyltransferase